MGWFDYTPAGAVYNWYTESDEPIPGNPPDESWSFEFDPAGAVGDATSSVIDSWGNAINNATGGGVSSVVGAAGTAGSNIAGSTALAAASGLVIPITALAGLWFFGPTIAKKLGV